MVEQSAEKIQSSILWQTICKAKYITASDAAKEAVWLWKFIDELKVAPFIDGPVLLYCDNTGAIAQAKSQDSISAPNIFYAVITLSERSWIEVTSTFKRLMEERTWLIHLLKLSKSKSLMITNRRWVYNTVPIGFSLSGSYWKMCLKVNH